MNDHFRKLVKNFVTGMLPLRVLHQLWQWIARSTDPFTGYCQWTELYDPRNQETLDHHRETMSHFSSMPLISVIMPVYNTYPEWLTAAVGSVLDQVYSKWELCIADDGSTWPHVAEILDRFQRSDERIRVVKRAATGHISEASNSALALAAGDFTTFLDHDDLLSPDALFQVARVINRFPDVKLVYSDEDKIGPDGARRDPYFKCDFNLELLYGQNFISHLGIYRTSILKGLGGLRAGFEGSQDYDLVLRFIEQIKAEEIIHIPKVLYHWRMHPGSTAQDSSEKPYAYNAAVRALTEHFQRMNLRASVEPLINGLYRLHYRMPEPRPLISVIIPISTSLNGINRQIRNLKKSTRYDNIEWIIVHPTQKNGIQHTGTKLRKDENTCFYNLSEPYRRSLFLHAGAQKAHGDLLCFFNSELRPENVSWLSEMAGVAIQEKTGAIGAKLLSRRGRISHAGYILDKGNIAGNAFRDLARDSYGYFGRAVLVQEMSAVSADCMVINRDVYLRSGGFDTQMTGLLFYDIDLCLRLKQAGYRNIMTPSAVLRRSACRWNKPGSREIAEEKHEIESDYLKNTWGEFMGEDPAYNVNLSFEGKGFNLSWPPRTRILKNPAKGSKQSGKIRDFKDIRTWWIYKNISRLYKEQLKDLLFSTFPVLFSGLSSYRYWKEATIFKLPKKSHWNRKFWRRQFLLYEEMAIPPSVIKSETPEMIHRLAVVIHVYYPDILIEILERLEVSDLPHVKLFITCPSEMHEEVAQMVWSFSFENEILDAQNKGRDILPFLHILPLLVDQGFTLLLKLHTKKSNHLKRRTLWKDDILDKLTGREHAGNHLDIFEHYPSVGMLGPVGNILPMSLYYGKNASNLAVICKEMMFPNYRLSNLSFIAGSMFYARTAGFFPLLNTGLKEDDFEEEKGQLDGTMAHVVERAMSLSMEVSGLFIVDSTSTVDKLSCHVNYKHHYIL